MFIVVNELCWLNSAVISVPVSHIDYDNPGIDPGLSRGGGGEAPSEIFENLSL